MRYRKFAQTYLDVRIDGGDELYCTCPFHDDSRPSMAFNVRKGLFVCYGCGESGGISKLVKQVGAGSVPMPSLSELRDHTERTLGGRQSAQPKVYPEEWLEQFTVLPPRIRDYLRNDRHLTRITTKRFRIGWDGVAKAITIPLHDSRGRLLGVNRRFMDSSVKYRYPKGFPRKSTLFSYHRVPMGSPVVAVTEGCFDALAFWNIGVPAVSVYGSSMSSDQRKALMSLVPKVVLIAADNDDAGHKLADQIEDEIGQRLMTTARLKYPAKVKDPNSMTPSKLRRVVDRSV